MKIIFFTFYLCLWCTIGFGQKPAGQFSEQKANFESQVDIQKRNRILNSKQVQRKKWYLDRRKTTDGSYINIAKQNRQALLGYKKSHPEHDRNAHGLWTFLGPNTSESGGKQGRVNSIDIHPTNDQIIYLCTANGGIWKSTIGGFSWNSLTDHLGILSFADLEIFSTNPDVLYAVSGDGNPAPDPTNYHGQGEVWSGGVYKSTNAGNTWELTEYEFPENITPTKLLMHPTNSNIQFIACKEGIYKTTDGWKSNVTKVHTEVAYDIEYHPEETQILYASGTNKIWVSDDFGDSFDLASDPDFAVMNGAGRVELAVTPDFPTYVAAIAGDWDNGSMGIFMSLLEGADNTWVLRDNTTNVVDRQGPYNMALCIDPDNYNHWYGGGFQLWKTTNEGQTGSWSNIGSGNIHEDQHDVVFRNGKIFAANDGGLFRSTDGGDTWIDLSAGLHISEIYRLSGTEDNGLVFLIGTQDNGMLRRTTSSTFKKRINGDGMESRIANDDENIMYGTRERARHIYRSTDGFDTYESVELEGGQGAWISPLVLDHEDSDIVFHGRDSVYRTSNGGDTWQFIGNPPGGKLNNMVQAKSNRNRMYASRGAIMIRSSNVLATASNVTWSQIGAGLPSDFITDIAVDPADDGHVFITKGNYSAGLKVFESTEDGDVGTWNNISGSLPNVPVLSIAYHDDGSGLDRLYIGTDIGVFYRDNNLGDWIYFSNYLPAVPVEDLYINTSNNTLAAGTYGRGLWRSDLIGSCDDNKYFSSGVTHTGHYHFSYSNTIESLAKLSTQPNTDITYRAGNFIDMKPGFEAPKKSIFNAQIGDCPY